MAITKPLGIEKSKHNQPQDQKKPNHPTVIAKGHLISKQNCQAITSPKKQMNEFVFLSWQLGNTLNFKSKFKFQVFPSLLYKKQKKTNSFICFLGEFKGQ